MLKVAYFPGCSLSSTAKEYDVATRLVCEDLEIDLVEIPEWTCCGATTAHITSELTAAALPAKSLIWAEKHNMMITSPCSACFSRLKMAHLNMEKDPKLKKEVEEVTGETYNGKAEVLHLTRVMLEKYGLENIKAKIKRELKGLKIACYYGCLMTRPPEVNENERVENPMIMDNLVSALGAEPVKWYYKTECCGAAFSLTKTEIVRKLSGDILKEAKACGADIIMVACPLCHSNLDARQPEISKLLKTNLNIPILYFTQVMGLALGYDYMDLMMNKHFIDPKPLLKSKGIL